MSLNIKSRYNVEPRLRGFSQIGPPFTAGYTIETKN
jgi:hypothetical protein